MRTGRYAVEPGMSNWALLTNLRRGLQSATRVTCTNIRLKSDLAERLDEQLMLGKEELLAQTARQLAAHEKPVCKPYAPSAEAVRLANAIDRVLEQPGDGKEAISCILRGASARYACCDDSMAAWEVQERT